MLLMTESSSHHIINLQNMQDDEAETYDVSLLPKEVLSVIEADSFWCLSKLLDGIQVSVTKYIELL
jgi:hypothetical protein